MVLPILSDYDKTRKHFSYLSDTEYHILWDCFFVFNKVNFFYLQPIDAADDGFWDQFWSENVTNVHDVFTLVPAPEIRALREEAPSNLATLCYKAVEKLVKAVDNSCRTHHEQQTGTVLQKPLLKCKKNNIYDVCLFCLEYLLFNFKELEKYTLKTVIKCS